MKKEWNTPKLEAYGSVQMITQVSVRDVTEGVVRVAKVGKFILPKAFGLFASVKGL